MPSVHHYNVLLEWDPDDETWISYVADLNYLSSFGTTRAEALANTHEAILGYLEAAAKEGSAVPAASHPAELVDMVVSVA